MTDRLQTSSIFKDIPEYLINKLQTQFTNIDFPAEALILKQGNPAQGLFYIVSGTVVIIKDVDNTEMFIESLKPGEIFGEMSIFSDRPVSVSIRTLEPATLRHISSEVLLEFIDRNPRFGIPFLKNIIRVLSERLFFTTDNLGFYLAEIKSSLQKKHLNNFKKSFI